MTDGLSLIRRVQLLLLERQQQRDLLAALALERSDVRRPTSSGLPRSKGAFLVQDQLHSE